MFELLIQNQSKKIARMRNLFKKHNTIFSSKKFSRLFLIYSAPIIVVLHFTMIILGFFQFDFHRLGRAGEILYLYAEASGTHSQFAFFSPGITSQIRVHFSVKDATFSTQKFNLTKIRNREVELRLGDIFDQFLGIEDSDSEDRDALRRFFAASLAGYIFGRVPDARSVAISIETFIPPSLYKENIGPPERWNLAYVIEFSRNNRGMVP